jgi:hypothetical protein
MSNPTQKPWVRAKLELHVGQRIRERLQISTMIEHETDPDGETHHVLRKDGEYALWVAIQHAIDEAGWQVCSGDCL